MVRQIRLFALFFTLGQIFCVLGFEIIRGQTDKISFGENDEQTKVSRRTMTCDRDRSSCECEARKGFKTLTYIESSNFVTCVRDEDIITQSEGTYLAKEKCLGATNTHAVKTMNCTPEDLSLRWLYWKAIYLLNLKTLTCLQANKQQDLYLARCERNNREQHWRIVGGPEYVFQNVKHKLQKHWIKSSKSNPYFTLLSGIDVLYKGCYRFANDNITGLVTRSKECENSQRKCSQVFKVRAPIFAPKKRLNFKINWKRSSYSRDGNMWARFATDGDFSANQDLFKLRAVDDENVTINITNRNKLVDHWSGYLMRLHVDGEGGGHCILFKIEGEMRQNFQTSRQFTDAATTDPTPIIVTLTTYSSIVKRDSNNLVAIVVPIALTLVLATVILGAIIYRRGKRLFSKRKSNTESQDVTEMRTREKTSSSEEIPNSYYTSLNKNRKPPQLYQSLTKNMDYEIPNKSTTQLTDLKETGEDVSAYENIEEPPSLYASLKEDIEPPSLYQALKKDMA